MAQRTDRAKGHARYSPLSFNALVTSSSEFSSAVRVVGLTVGTVILALCEARPLVKPVYVVDLRSLKGRIQGDVGGQAEAILVMKGSGRTYGLPMTDPFAVSDVRKTATCC